MDPVISFRPIRAEDFEFLYRVYASTRRDIEQVPWSDAEKRQFLQMQFQAQHIHYQQYFANAEFQIILRDNISIGRLYVDRQEVELHIIDIALLPEYRRQGIGGSILNDLLAEAAQAGQSVRIYVEQFNPALVLYERLGFQRTGDTGVYYEMKWVPTR